MWGQIDIAAATFNGVLVILEHSRHLVQSLLPPSLTVSINVLDNYQKPSGLSSYFWNDVSFQWTSDRPKRRIGHVLGHNVKKWDTVFALKCVGAASSRLPLTLRSGEASHGSRFPVVHMLPMNAAAMDALRIDQGSSLSGFALNSRLSRSNDAHRA